MATYTLKWMTKIVELKRLSSMKDNLSWANKFICNIQRQKKTILITIIASNIQQQQQQRKNQTNTEWWWKKKNYYIPNIWPVCYYYFPVKEIWKDWCILLSFFPFTHLLRLITAIKSLKRNCIIQLNTHTHTDDVKVNFFCWIYLQSVIGLAIVKPNKKSYYFFLFVSKEL